MDEMLTKIPDWLNFASVILSSVVVIATVISRLTPSKKDDEITGKVAGLLFKAIKWLPTLGVNPQTKKLEQAYEELKKKE